MTRPDPSRRRFLRAASLISATASTATPFAINLAAVGAAAAQSASDYRALVCLFMFGGNDQGNTVLATDAASWAEYTRYRATPPDPIALAAPGATGGVLPIVASTPQSGREFALHPNLSEIKTLFDAGRAAVIANVGTLVEPTTKDQYDRRTVRLPRQLFSHNDQSSTWQSYEPEGARVGWGGRIGDLFAAGNGQSTFTCISAAGNAVWLAGQSAVQYQVSANGATAIGGLTGTLFGSSSAPAALRSILTADRVNLFEKEYSRITARSIDAQAQLNAAMLPAASLEAVPVVPGTTQANSLAAQLLTVARIIGGRSALSARRQVFFVSLGGFDTHDAQNRNHGDLMTRLGQALAYFDRLMASPSVDALDKVTLFTGSDFGRTLTSNGDGTDHGWGGHHFVVGGAVRGGDVYGRFPLIGVNTADDVGQGRLLPGVAVDQYAATLARWFGLSDAQLGLVLPNLANFSGAPVQPNYTSATNLGFMRP